jgi:hypothetical protein
MNIVKFSSIMVTASLFLAVSCKSFTENSSVTDISSDVRGTPARTFLRSVVPNNKTNNVLSGFGSNPNCFMLVSQPGKEQFVEYYLDGFSVPVCNSDTNARILSTETKALQFAHVKVMQQTNTSRDRPACFWNTQQQQQRVESEDALGYAIKSTSPAYAGEIIFWRRTPCADATDSFMFYPEFEIDFENVDVHINSSGVIDKFQLKK